MTLLQQLIFLFDSQDRDTNIHFTDHTITLEMKKVAKVEQVTKIASRMGLTCDTTSHSSIRLSAPAPLKEDIELLPETPFQVALKELFFGNSTYIGLAEYLSYFEFKSSYYKGWEFKGSQLEDNYLKVGGWNKSFKSGPKYNEITHPLWQAFIREYERTVAYSFNDKTPQFEGLTCIEQNSFGTKPRPTSFESGFTDTYKGNKYMSYVLQQIVNRRWLFPNGEMLVFQSEISREDGDARYYTYNLVHREASPLNQMMALLEFQPRGNHIKKLHKTGVLQQYFDVEKVVVPKRSLVIHQRDFTGVVRGALGAYIHGGKLNGYTHGVVGGKVVFHHSPEPTFEFSDTRTPMRSKSAFNKVVTEELQKVVRHYRSEYDVTVI